MPAAFLGEGMECDGPPFPAEYTHQVTLGVHGPGTDDRIEQCSEWLERDETTKGEFDWNFVMSKAGETMVIFHFTDPDTAFQFKIRFC